MIQPRHFLWRVEGKVGVVTLNRPERKNPLTFESYAELRDLFLGLKKETPVKSIVITGAGGNFCIINGSIRASSALAFARVTPGLRRAIAW